MEVIYLSFIPDLCIIDWCPVRCGLLDRLEQHKSILQKFDLCIFTTHSKVKSLVLGTIIQLVL